jgi:RNA polymerase sigma factor (sigma-70 family)
MAAAADQLPLETLFARHHADTVAWCERAFHDRSLAEDAVQEAFMQLAGRNTVSERLRLERGASLVRRNTHWAAQKLSAHDRSAAAREESSRIIGLREEDAWIRYETRSFVESICQRLPRRHREALHLRYAEGYSDAESAQRLSITVKAFRRRVDRELAAARVACAEQEPNRVSASW